MTKNIILICILSLLFSGCASVQMESVEKSDQAKMFNLPKGDSSGIYVYRSGVFGSALKKDVWIDGKCIGETAPNIFFYEEVGCNEQHTVSTESEFSANELVLTTECGKNYFLRQYIKMGVFVGGAGIEQVSEEEGKKEVKSLKLAAKGNCSATNP
ncbi:DUF2846 domain-containing protein [Hahella sp. KA22]|uniref:DUF2846 domain-containing protein n=1 Tax=Hahella sp. KA22 TaxID=1628392 RepID=UPI000FDEAC94|nr:DUF2846 domain-containing protein [Hahella sp. KA22]AZZ91829.1 DUF2846 domain-containing protein [Hahella sp. KA22]QAY55199.1 DUF2846 domain-containing protein [Hahella sp. KA22]